MRRFFRSLSFIALGVAVIMGLARCAKHSDEEILSVKVQAARDNSTKRKMRSGSRFSAVPTAISDFDCYAVNVMGDNISEAGASPNRASLDKLIEGSSVCGYAGRLSPLISASEGATVQLAIPRGPKRVIQVLGIVSPGGCSVSESLAQRFSNQPSTVSDSVFPGVYEIGRAVVDVTTATSVSISGNYSYAASMPPRDVRCAIAHIDCTNSANTGASPVGDGSEANPYRICTAAQLASLSDNDGYYTLETNIDLGQISWTPLFPTNHFIGEFDGQGYTLSNLTYNNSVTSAVGLFSTMGLTSPSVVPGVLKQINLADINIASSSTASVGGLVGTVAAGRITDANVSGSIAVSGAATGIGGAVGGAQNLTAFSQIFSSVSVAVTGQGESVGGLLGSLSIGTGRTLAATRLSSTGTVTAATANNVGGMIGLAGGASGTMTLSKSSATGAVSGENIVGGFIGQSTIGTFHVSNCYSTGNVSYLGTVAPLIAGGFIAYISAGASTVANSYCSASSVTGADGALKSGFIASAANVTRSNSYSNAVLGDAGTGVGLLSSAEMTRAANFTGFDFTEVWDIKEGVSTPTLR